MLEFKRSLFIKLQWRGKKNKSKNKQKKYKQKSQYK